MPPRKTTRKTTPRASARRDPPRLATPSRRRRLPSEMPATGETLPDWLAAQKFGVQLARALVDHSILADTDKFVGNENIDDVMESFGVFLSWEGSDVVKLHGSTVAKALRVFLVRAIDREVGRTIIGD